MDRAGQLSIMSGSVHNTCTVCSVLLITIRTLHDCDILVFALL